MCPLQPCKDPTTVDVWWRDDSEWNLYSKVHANMIRKGVSDGLHKVNLGNIVSTTHPMGQIYVADLARMKQINLSSRQERDIRIVQQADRVIRVEYTNTVGKVEQYDPDLGLALLRQIGN
ncbi:hypothetical protein O6H91_13G070000 [Diphasiastrum complanatum]|uniref:Uncharacterized protein n=1 Tax=Diphasiastrum complanatum TaxID=34168 RepID=A0ACC2BVV7_DIPCM|nr:hypothetical protein O6H91_13G070000 [Diphasiastrum complanatum]